MSVEETFAGRLKRAMTAKRMTVRDLVEACDHAFGQRTIFRWRSGSAAPGVEALPILAKALEVSVGWLAGAADGGPSSS